jgi:hypothetical protein
MVLTVAGDRPVSPGLQPSIESAMVQMKHKRASVNGVNLHYVTVGSSPAVRDAVLRAGLSGLCRPAGGLLASRLARQHGYRTLSH